MRTMKCFWCSTYCLLVHHGTPRCLLTKIEILLLLMNIRHSRCFWELHTHSSPSCDEAGESSHDRITFLSTHAAMMTKMSVIYLKGKYQSPMKIPRVFQPSDAGSPYTHIPLSAHAPIGISWHRPYSCHVIKIVWSLVDAKTHLASNIHSSMRQHLWQK